MIELGITVTLLAVGYFFGSRTEKAHFNELRVRESQLLTKVPYSVGIVNTNGASEARLVTGSVVIASDYFKTFVANIKSLFGGRLTTQEALLDRGRREALCRMREEALKWGAAEVIDVHLQTSFLDQSGIEILAYGTALKK